MNYLEELQKINEDFQKCKMVVKSCVWDSQLESAGTYCNNFVSYHIGRLGYVKRYKRPNIWTIHDAFTRELKLRKKIIEYIDLCVDELKYLIECQKDEVYPYSEKRSIGYADPNTKMILKIQQNVTEWETKKKKEYPNYENRETAREKLQIN